MSLKLFQQCGHNTIWNINSISQDVAGDGLILSPVHYKKDEIERIGPAVKKMSLFDPQFYLPNSQKKKLKSYPFFPEVIADGFTSQVFENHALDAAKLCVAFQEESSFDAIIIPARFFDQMDPDYIEKQESYTVLPFLEAIQSLGITRPVYMTLPMTSHMLKNVAYRTQLLNWATKFPEIKGVYLFCTAESDTKQITDKLFMQSYLEFVRELSNADLQVIVGYLNTEGVLFSLIDNVAITMGSFENTRMFSLDKFIITDEDRRGPKARIFIPGLLNWIEFGQAKNIRDLQPDLWAKIHEETTYSESVFGSISEPTFNQSPLYSHHFKIYSKLIGEFRDKTIDQRFHLLRTKIKSAIAYYDAIEAIPFDFEKHGSKAHLQQWLDVINIFYSKYVKQAQRP